MKEESKVINFLKLSMNNQMIIKAVKRKRVIRCNKMYQQL